MSETPIIVRTLCDEGFSAFLTNFIHFKRPRKLVIVKYAGSDFTNYQRTVMEGLSLRGWHFVVTEAQLGDERSCYATYRYILDHSITKFFLVDDDVICPEKGYDLLESLSQPRTIVAYATWNLHLNDYSWETKNAGDKMIINPHPALFNLDRVVKDPDLENLDDINEFQGGWAILILVLSRYVDSVIAVKAKDLSIHIRFPREASRWRNIGQLNFDALLRRCIEKYNPNYRCEFIEVEV
jgi:hypothetical protein